MNTKFSQFLLCMFVLLSANHLSGQTSDKAELIQQAVQHQMTTYPQSTLRDLYKNFFQDVFGPGHLISDTAIAGKYLREELLLCDTQQKRLYEPTGYSGNYYRVHLTVLAQKMVSYQRFFDAFVKSAERQPQMSIAQWKNEWTTIDSIIQNMNLNLPDEQKDRQDILELLQNNQYVLHHSQLFNKTYRLHYRIIEKSVFEKEILPYLPKNSTNL